MTVYQRGNVWWCEFCINGLRVRKSTHAISRAEALREEILRKAEAAHERNDRSGQSPRFSDFALREFAPWCKTEHQDHPSTYRGYMFNLDNLIQFFGERRLDRINTGHVEKYKLYRSQQRRKTSRDNRLITPAAVNRDLAVLKILFSFAIRLGMTTNNPVVGVRYFAENNQSTRVLSAEEERKYLKAAYPLLRDLATLILDTGLRPGELFRLRMTDVNLNDGYLSVRHGKTPTARRHIPLTRRSRDVLERRFRNANSEWIFGSPKVPDRPVTKVSRAHHAAVRRSGIKEPFRLYDLRHTALTRMAMAGMDLPTLREIAGHSEITSTMRYVHPTPEHKRRAMEKFEDFIRNYSSDTIGSGAAGQRP